MESSAQKQEPKKGLPTTRPVLVAGALILVLAVFFAFGRRDHEPVCNGKTLSHWAIHRVEDIRFRARYGRPDPEAASHPANAQAAIQHIGTNGLPFLLDWLAHEDPAPRLTWKQKAIDLVTKIPMPKKFQAGLRNTSFNAYPEQPPRPTPADALWCFHVLGSNAAPAIPQLAKIAAQRDNWQASIRAIDALGGIGGDSVPTLLDLATNYACPTRRQVIITLVQFVKAIQIPDMNVISRTLVRCVKDGDIAVERQAARSLGELKVDPAIAFPVLTNGLPDPNLAYACVEALGNYGEIAQPTLPSLLALANSSDPDLRNGITNAVVRINPGAFESPQQ